MHSDPEQPDFPLGEAVVTVSPHHKRVDELFRREHSRLVKYLTTHTGSADEADEIAAEAFTKLLAYRFPATVNSLSNYLYRTAQNLATNRGTRAARPQQRHAAKGSELPQSGPAPDPELACINEERSKLLNGIIETLPPRARMALRLRYWQDLNLKEVVGQFAAQQVGLNERTVRRYLKDSLARCREAIRASKDLEQEERK